MQTVLVGNATTYSTHHWSVEWLERSSDTERERTAGRSDGEFLTRHRDGFRKLNADGDHQAAQHRWEPPR